MIVSLILVLLMASVVMFSVSTSTGLPAATALYGIFLMYIFIRMTFAKDKDKSKYRRIFQTVYAVLFCISFIGILFDERGSMAITTEAMSNGEIPFCHIAIPQILTPLILTKEMIFPARVYGHYASISSMLCIWFMFTLILGRGWCSWACFYGGWEDGFSRLAKKRRLNFISKNKEIRNFQFAFLIFIVLVSLGEMAAVYCNWFCPFKTVTEYFPMTTIPGLIAGIMFIGLFLGLVVILPILSRRRVQCSTLCPFGAFASLTDKISVFRIRIDSEKCKGCMKCVNTCPFGAIDIKTIQDKKGAPELTCAKCGECIGVCEQKAISYAFRFQSKCTENAPKTKFGKGLERLLHPETLFRFAAFSFGAIMSSSFSIDAITRIMNKVISLFM